MENKNSIIGAETAYERFTSTSEDQWGKLWEIITERSGSVLHPVKDDPGKVTVVRENGTREDYIWHAGDWRMISVTANGATIRVKLEEWEE